MSRHRIQTAESVTAGHADKICDLIADAILDAILAEDRYARVSCEVMVTTGMVIVTGQITTKCYVDITAKIYAAQDRKQEENDQDAAGLSHGLNDEHPWHDGCVGEMLLEKRLVEGHVFQRHDSFTLDEFDHAVHQ